MKINKKQHKKIVKLIALLEARIVHNESIDKWSNVRLIHYTFQDIFSILGIDFPNGMKNGSVTNLQYKYQDQLEKNISFKPKGFEQDILYSI